MQSTVGSVAAAAAAPPALSFVSPIGASYYLRTKALSPEHYQELMDRGWRRSGSLTYLPDASRSCCPHYTIRLRASEFRPSRDHRQALNRWNRFVLGEEYLHEVNLKYPPSKDAVHEAEVSYLRPGIKPAHEFKVVLGPDNFTDEKFLLFDHYQRQVHHEGDADISKAGFRRFLCSSPVVRRTSSEGMKLGTYHQCYRLDGRLIAMAVLDLLPHGVSAVYFIYHGDFEKWSFGKLSALRETALTLEQNYQYYYMGYYIHSCKKMRYKGDYKPQYVLDYDSLAWYPLDDEMRTLMDKQKYIRMSKQHSLSSSGDSRSKSHITEEESGLNESVHQDDEIMYPNPLDAMQSRLSLLQLGMPGVLTLSALREQIDLDRMQVRIHEAQTVEMKDIQSWDGGSELESKSLKGIFAELAAVVGPKVAMEAIVDFG